MADAASHIQLYMGSAHLDPGPTSCVSRAFPTEHLPGKDSLLLLVLIPCPEVLQCLL